jgi:hypothetical protein
MSIEDGLAGSARIVGDLLVATFGGSEAACANP